MAPQKGLVITSVIWGENTDRVRSIWRISVPLFFGLLAFVVSFVAGSMFDIPQGRAQVVPFLVTPVVVYGVVRLTARWLDKRPVRAYGLNVSRGWWYQASGGLFLGSVIILVTLLIANQLGSVALAEMSVSSVSFLWIGLFAIGFVGVAFWEELLFRGVFIVNGVEGISNRGHSFGTAVLVALVGSSAVFSLLHIPGGIAEGHAAWLIAMWTASLGLLTAVAYILTGELALPMGLHFAINFIPINVIGLSPTATMEGVPTIVAVESMSTGLAAPMVGLPITVANLFGCVLIASWVYYRRGDLTPRISTSSDPL